MGHNRNNVVTNTPKTNDFVQVSCSLYHCTALKKDGSLESWGYDSHNQVTNTPETDDFIKFLLKGDINMNKDINPYYETLENHIGHNIECAKYGDENIAIECVECNEVLVDYDRYMEPAMTYIDNKEVDIIKKYVKSTMTNDALNTDDEFNKGVLQAGEEIEILIKDIENGEYSDKELDKIEFTGNK